MEHPVKYSDSVAQLIQRASVGSQAEIAGAASTASAIIRALLENADLSVAPPLVSETAHVLEWLEELRLYSSQGHKLSEFTDRNRVTEEDYEYAGLIARAAMPVAHVDPESPDEIRLNLLLANKEAISVEEREDTRALRVNDPVKAETLAAQLEVLADVLLENAFDTDRERSSQFAIA